LTKETRYAAIVIPPLAVAAAQAHGDEVLLLAEGELADAHHLRIGESLAQERVRLLTPLLRHEVVGRVEVAGIDLVGLHEIGHLHRIFALARRKQRRLIDDVGQVRADEPRCLGGDHAEFDARRQFDLLGVKLKNLFSALYVRAVDQNLAIEPTGPKQRGIENFRPVGCGHDNYALVRIEAVHFGK